MVNVVCLPCLSLNLIYRSVLDPMCIPRFRCRCVVVHPCPWKRWNPVHPVLIGLPRNAVQTVDSLNWARVAQVTVAVRRCGGRCELHSG